MTVKELIDELSECDLELEVVFAYNSRDYWNTDVAQVVKGAEEGSVTYSKYHDMYTPLKEREFGDEPLEDEGSPVVVITGKGKLYRR